MRDFVCILSTYVCTQWFRRKLFFFIPFFAPIFIPTLFRIVSWTLRIAFFYIHIRAGCTRALFSRTAPFLLLRRPPPRTELRANLRNTHLKFTQICASRFSWKFGQFCVTPYLNIGQNFSLGRPFWSIFFEPNKVTLRTRAQRRAWFPLLQIKRGVCASV